jgi:hypothetical protein
LQTAQVCSQLFDQPRRPQRGRSSSNAIESRAAIGNSRELKVAGGRGHTHIEMIDVQCDVNAGMLVTVEFEEPFSGVIYSQGYFNDPKCR